MLLENCKNIKFNILDNFVSNHNDSIYLAMKIKPKDATPNTDIDSTFRVHKKEPNS